MSGVGVTGLIANLPGTITPYPTQDPNLELGGCRQVADVAARDLIPANFRVADMLVTLQDTGVTYQLHGGLTNADWRTFTGDSFKGAYYVNSSFAGVQLGSQSNPFVSAAAAFTYAATVGVTSGVVFLGQNHTENVVFPVGGDWELSGMNGAGRQAITLTGTVDLTCTSIQRRALSNLTVSGAVTGNAPTGGATRSRFLNCYLLSTVTLTASGSGLWRASFSGLYQPGFNSLASSVTGLVTVNGQVTSLFCTFFGGLTLTGAAELHEFSGSSFINPITTNVTGNSLRFLNKCEWNAGQVFVSAGTTTIQLDGSSWYNLNNITPTFTGTFVITTMNANRSQRVVVTDNVAPQGLTTGSVPSGQMTLTATLTLLAAGTLGTAVVNVIYTDLIGVTRTVPLGAGLNIAGTAGDEFTAEKTFVMNGTTVAYTVTGITTPGALSLNVSLNLKAEY